MCKKKKKKNAQAYRLDHYKNTQAIQVYGQVWLRSGQIILNEKLVCSSTKRNVFHRYMPDA